MVSVADVPEVLYLNERQVENLYSYISEEQVVEILHDSQDDDTDGGWRKLLQLRYGDSLDSAENTDDGIPSDLIRDPDSIAKFATLHANLEEEDDIHSIDDLGEDTRDGLEEGDFVETKGRVRTSAIDELQQTIDGVSPLLSLFDMEIDESEEDFTLNDIQNLMDQLNTSEDLYMLEIPSGDLEADLVFSLDEMVSQGKIDFPSEYTEYSVLGRVDHTYDEREERSLMDIMDMLPGNDRESRQQRRQFMRQLSLSASEVLDRDIDREDFKISHPDIQVKPMAIYLF